MGYISKKDKTSGFQLISACFHISSLGAHGGFFSFLGDNFTLLTNQQLVNKNFGGTNTTIELPVCDICAELDLARIKLMLNNLLENAVRHNSADTQPPIVSVH